MASESPFIKTKVRKSSGRFMAYGVWWEPNVDPASMQLDCIRAGGKWVNKSTGEMAGEGLYFHFRQFQEIVWPEKIWQKGPYKNYWAEKILECYLEATYLGLMGCASSSKSDSLGSIVLTDWYAWPDCTTVLVSSTDLKMLELRIWGMIKKYHKAAKKNREWIPGHLIEGKQMILQDSRGDFVEGRDYKNSVVGVPCKRGNQWVGLGSYIGIHNKRVRLIADECFPAGTMVDTVAGPRRIETIKRGDLVVCAAGLGRVAAASQKTSPRLVKITTRDGRVIYCTEQHPFFTQLGWKKACELHQGCFILSAYEAMQILRSSNPRREQQSMVLGMRSPKKDLPSLQKRVSSVGAFQIKNSEELQSILQHEINVPRPGSLHSEEQESLYSKAKANERGPRFCEAHIPSQHRQEANTRTAKGYIRSPEGFWPSTENSRGKWNWPIQGREGLDEVFPVRSVELLCEDGKMEWKRVSSSIQVGLCISEYQALHRGRWWVPQWPREEGYGREERRIPEGAWVDHIEIQEQSNSGPPRNNEGSYTVYNLQVEGHSSYSVSGLLVHNCNLMSKGFLDSTANLSKCEDFKMAAPGNPNETTNAHGILCEPAIELGGWEGGIDQQPGTKTWKTRYPNGLCLQLPGADSPNLKAPENEEVPFPFLITRQQMEDDAQVWGRDDWHYQMFTDAKMPRGQGSHRVITRQECEKFGATLEAFWRDSNITKIASLDAAYRSSGGDRCVFTEIHFGKESESNSALISADAIISQRSNVPQGRQIMALVDQMVIPIDSGLSADTPEAQIQKFCRSQCEARGIPAENFFVDSGMRTSLIQELSRNWSVDVQSIDCGAAPTDQKVSAEIDMPCHDYYKKLITQIWFSIRLVIISRQFRNLSKDVMWELCAREWKTSSGNKIEVETKEEMKEKTGKSPDLGDGLGLAVFGAIQRGFQIATLRMQHPQQNINKDDWRTKLRDRAKKLSQSGQLEYAAS